MITKTGKIANRFAWFNQQPWHKVNNGRLHVITDPNTDFWQGTYYGFRPDSGHCLLTEVKDDFSLTVRTEFHPKNQYDQCGLFVRGDLENWIKASTEYEDETAEKVAKNDKLEKFIAAHKDKYKYDDAAKTLVVKGKMNEEEKNELLTAYSSPEEKEAINRLFRQSQDDLSSRLGSVVTNKGWSDWTTTDVDSSVNLRWYRIQSLIQSGLKDFKIEYSDDGASWHQLRITHLHDNFARLRVGIYACSPNKEEGFEAIFDNFSLVDSMWVRPAKADGK